MNYTKKRADAWWKWRIIDDQIFAEQMAACPSAAKLKKLRAKVAVAWAAALEADNDVAQEGGK